MRYEYIEEVTGACRRVMAGLEDLEAMVRRMEGVADEACSSRCFSHEEMRSIKMVMEIASRMKNELHQDNDALQQAVTRLRRIDS